MGISYQLTGASSLLDFGAWRISMQRDHSKVINGIRNNSLQRSAAAGSCEWKFQTTCFLRLPYLLMVLVLQFVAGLKHDINGYDASVLICLVATALLMSSLSMLFVSNTPLPTWRTSWIQTAASAVRKFKPSTDNNGITVAKKNQFGIGDLNFNYLAVFVILLPIVFQLVTSPATSIESTFTDRRILFQVGGALGSAGAYALTFFLIPVARHSVLLAALGWSPIHAMRLHVWAGYVAFFFELGHSIVLVVDWFVFGEGPVRNQVFPEKRCWGWTWNPDFSSRNFQSPDYKCYFAWVNLTGVFAMLWFIILTLTSLNWVRRHHYCVFYVNHVVFGTAALLTSIAHEKYLVIVFLPSIIYYLASTTPVLVQALATRFRGGVRIVNVVDVGGYVEAHIAISKESLACLNSEPSLFVKVCVPQISLVWHPFTVYNHTKDPTTVRLLIRPAGYFTKKFTQCLLAPERPVTIVDGFYRTSNRAVVALQHDQVTIVAGGAGLAPFLSMIPGLLANIAVPPAAEVPPITKSIELHWVCREALLIDYFQHNYLAGMLETARKVNSVQPLKFHIVIYYTGTAKKAIMVELDESAKTKTEDEESVPEQTKQVPVEETSVTELADSKANEKTHDPNKCFEMEPARLMPGRYSQIWRNIPAFVGLSFSLWIGMWVMFHWENKETYRVNYILATTFWGQLVALLVILGFSILMEVVVLIAAKHWPVPKRDVFDIEEYLVKEHDDVQSIETEGMPSVDLTKRDGRPTMDEILATARLADAPGVFLCGPKALTDLAKHEVAKENSVFGLTRFCVYDEPSEV